MMVLALPVPPTALREIIRETVAAGGHADCTVRLLVTRGPGSFGVNPYDCPAAQVYVTAIALPVPFMQRRPDGAIVGVAALPAKDAFFARTKNCNYLVNALMKKQAVDTGADFMAAFDAAGCLAEGATESMGIVTESGELVFPPLDGILCGTTMMRVIELAETAVAEGVLSGVAQRPVQRADIARAAEFLVVGTTIDVVAATRFDGRPVAGGVPGPVYARLSQLLAADIAGGPHRTLVE